MTGGDGRCCRQHLEKIQHRALGTEQGPRAAADLADQAAGGNLRGLADLPIDAGVGILPLQTGFGPGHAADHG
jgi:hypothetical protein